MPTIFEPGKPWIDPKEDEAGDETGGTTEETVEGSAGKGWAQSKTVWTGGIVAAMSALGFVQAQEWCQDHPAIMAACGIAIGILMIVLRFLSNQVVTPRMVVVRRDKSKTISQYGGD